MPKTICFYDQFGHPVPSFTVEVLDSDPQPDQLFSSIAEAEDFIRWYESTGYHTNWDVERYRNAKTILSMERK